MTLAEGPCSQVRDSPSKPVGTRASPASPRLKFYGHRGRQAPRPTRQGRSSFGTQPSSKRCTQPAKPAHKRPPGDAAANPSSAPPHSGPVPGNIPARVGLPHPRDTMCSSANRWVTPPRAGARRVRVAGGGQAGTVGPARQGRPQRPRPGVRTRLAGGPGRASVPLELRRCRRTGSRETAKPPPATVCRGRQLDRGCAVRAPPRHATYWRAPGPRARAGGPEDHIQPNPLIRDCMQAGRPPLCLGPVSLVALSPLSAARPPVRWY